MRGCSQPVLLNLRDWFRLYSQFLLLLFKIKKKKSSVQLKEDVSIAFRSKPGHY